MFEASLNCMLPELGTQEGKNERWRRTTFAQNDLCRELTILESEKRERNYATFCCKYAAEAAAVVLQAAQRNCGYSGARWSPNLQEHLNWCFAAAKDYPTYEAKMRSDGLQACSQRR